MQVSAFMKEIDTALTPKIDTLDATFFATLAEVQ